MLEYHNLGTRVGPSNAFQQLNQLVLGNPALELAAACRLNKHVFDAARFIRLHN